MRYKTELIFVEVRTRQETAYGRAEETVAQQKQRKLIRAAQWWQQANGYWGNARFDVVAIERKESGVKIDHIENAFMVT